MSSPRNILIAVDDTDASQMMVQWILDSDLLLPDDKVHLLHITIRDTTGNANLPGADYFDQAHPQEAHRCVMAMLQQRFLGSIEQLGIRPVVHIVQASQDPKTVGRIICAKAEDLACQHVYVAHHQQQQHSKLARMLSGPSVPEYVQQHCKVPLTIVAQAGDSDMAAEFQHGQHGRAAHEAV